MAKRIIVWTETAIIQRRNIFKYWTERNDSSKYAIQILKIIKTRLTQIAKFPEAAKKLNTKHERNCIRAFQYLPLFHEYQYYCYGFLG